MEAIIFYLLKSAGVLAIFFFSYQLLLKKETFFKVNRHYLLAGILASLLMPLVIFKKHVYVEPLVQTFDPNMFLSNIPLTNEAIEIAEPFNWLKLATYIYVIGVIVFGFRFFVQLTSLLRMFKLNPAIEKDGFKLIEIEVNISPFSFFNYIVYNPNTYTNQDLEIIINHEKAHGNQLHSIDILISQIFLILQWFNPLAWLYKKTIQQNLEFMADKYAISHVDSAKQYQHTLLRASLRPQYASITNNFYNSLIKKRIIMLNQSKSNIKNAWKYFVILPALALFLMSFNAETVEVVKKSEPSDFSTSSEFSLYFEDSTIPNKAKPQAKSKAAAFANKMIESKVSFLQNLIKVKIDKNTTDAELKELKEKLKTDGVDFNYKNVKRNDKNEIIAISVQYKDSHGNEGNYSLSSENPISAFIFYKEEAGSVGFKSENLDPEYRMRIVEARELSRAKREEMMKEQKEFREQHRDELMKEHELMMKERKEMMEEQKAMSEEERKEIRIRMEEARKEHAKARKEHEEQRKMIIKERIKLNDSMRSNYDYNYFIDKKGNKTYSVDKGKPLIIIDGKEGNKSALEFVSPKDIAHIKVIKGEKALEIYGDKGKDGVIVIQSKKAGEPWKVEYDVDAIEFDDEDFENDKDHNFSYHVEELDDESNIKIFGKHLPKDSKTMLLKKSATDDYLRTMKSFFKEQGIDFKYSKLKRNNDGKITRIKVSLNDNKGNKSSSTFDSGDKGINPILIGKNNNRLTIKSL